MHDQTASVDISTILKLAVRTMRCDHQELSVFQGALKQTHLNNTVKLWLKWRLTIARKPTEQHSLDLQVCQGA